MKPIRKTAPEPLEPVAFQIPPAHRVTLDNGLRVVIVADERLPLVSYRLAFLSGDAAEPSDRIGVTSAMASQITEGTENYSSLELAEKIERIGGTLRASSSDDFSMVVASALSIYGTEVLDLMAEIVFVPTFPEKELDLYRRNMVENLKFQRSQPNFLANEQIARLLFEGHPYATISPSTADVEKLTREDLEAARKRTFLPNNAVLTIVGDVREEEILDKVRERFGNWGQGDVPSNVLPDIAEKDSRELVIVDRPGSAQANIVLANIGVRRNDPDYFPLIVMNQVLGAGASSRVFMNLREEKGYTYGAYTRLDTRLLSGLFEATAEVRTAVTGDSLKEFFYELNRIRDEDILQEELEDAKNFLTGVFPIRAETQEGLTNLIVNQELYGLPEDYLQTYRDNVDAVTVEDVRRVANEHIKPDRMTLVIVGDAAEILRQAEGYADSIRVFDTAGNENDPGIYASDPSEEPADVAGTWTLSLEFMGQSVPVTLVLEQEGSSVSGTLTTMLGESGFENGKVNGSKISAASVTELQGQQVEFLITATADGNKMEGSISSSMLPQTLAFSGERQS